MKINRILGTAMCAAFATASWAQSGQSMGDSATIDRIIEAGKSHDTVMNLLDELTHKIGSRLTGSPRLEKAQAWSIAKFKSWGLSNVHWEKWGEIPVGWEREPDTSGRMVVPFDVPLTFTTPDWTEGTDGPLRGPAIIAPTTKADFDKVKDRLKGAWVLTSGSVPRPRRQSTTTTPVATPDTVTEADQVKKMVDEAGIAGRVYASRNELAITFGTWRNKTAESHPKDRQIILTKSSMERIMRSIDRGRPVELEFNLHHVWRKGPVSIGNVVADIPGTEKPDEMVIVSGHQDSWDGPGSQGALDNGTGTCTAMEAAHILMLAKAKPKRTIRFILWTGEEQGLFGSAAYVEAHKAEMDKISAVLVDDGGSGYQAGYIGPESMRGMMEAAFAPSNVAFPTLPEKYVVVANIRRQETGSDHASFWKYGVPGFFTIEGGNLDYNFIHHTQNDRYEQANAEYLVQSATNHAIVSYNLACADRLLPRDMPPSSR